jgi:hypothetical protein
MESGVCQFPFINPDLSLSERVTMLSTYAHLAFVLFQEYRLGFMSNQLYGDTQSTVKNIMFTVAKQHQRDPEGSVNANGLPLTSARQWVPPSANAVHCRSAGCYLRACDGNPEHPALKQMMGYNADWWPYLT